LTVFYNEILLITTMFVSVLQLNTKFYLSKWWHSVRGELKYRRRNRVCSQYTR